MTPVYNWATGQAAEDGVPGRLFLPSRLAADPALPSSDLWTEAIRKDGTARSGARCIASTMASYDAIFDSRENAVRTTVTLDDELLSQARAFTGIQENSALIQQALRALVQREAARRLARLGGSAPNLQAAPRRQGKVADDPR